MSEAKGDIPKTVAVILYTTPPLVIKAGLAFLRAKRRARRSAKHVLRGMVEGGIPPELARRLADDYEARLSVRNIMSGVMPGPMRWR